MPITDAFKDRPKTLADYLAILRRRKWLVVLPPVAAGIAAFFLSSAQPELHRADSQILVDRTSVVTAITQIADPSLGDPSRFLATQASIARSPDLAARVAARMPGFSPDTVLDETSVTPSDDADLLIVSATDQNADIAVRLANTFASEFTRFTKQRATQNINEALASLQTRIQQLAARGQRDTPVYDTLIEQSGQLATVGRLLAGNTSVLRPADGAEQIQPRPKRSAFLGILFGVVLGVALAFLAEALDRYVRDEHEIDEALQHPLLGRIPQPPRGLRKANALVMLEDPRSVYAETFRKLRASLEFVNPDGAARTIMVTSAVAQEGKSTTIANLAVALARSGRRIALVDLDLRAPFLGRLFRENGRPGITDVAVGRATLEQAIRPIALSKASRGEDRRVNGRTAPPGNGAAPVEGVLHLLTAGTLPPSADEMLQDPRLLNIIDELATKFDTVLIDAPPLLAFGDAMTLSTKADAMFATTRLGRLQRPILHEFARQLHACKAEVLGYVVTGVEHSDSYRYMYQGYVYDTRVREAKARDTV